jgi:hypothetical protein
MPAIRRPALSLLACFCLAVGVAPSAAASVFPPGFDAVPIAGAPGTHGDLFRVTTTGPEGKFQTAPEAHKVKAAYDALHNRTLATWRAGVSGDRHIYARIIEFGLDGGLNNPSDDGVELSDEVGGDPAVAYGAIDGTSDGKYLVVWTQLAPEGDFVEIVGKLVGSNGTAGALIHISKGATTDEYTTEFPSVAWNPAQNEYLVVFKGRKTSATNGEVFAIRVKPDGGVRSGIKPVSDDLVATDEQGTAVAYSENGGKYLVAWPDDGRHEMRGRFVKGSDGNALGASDFQISDVDGAAMASGFPQMTYDASAKEFAVFWRESEGSTVPVIMERHVSDAGALGAETSVSRPVRDGPVHLGVPAFDSRRGTVFANWAGRDQAGGLAVSETELFGTITDWSTSDATPAPNFRRFTRWGLNGDANYDVAHPAAVYSSEDDEIILLFEADDAGTFGWNFEIWGVRLSTPPDTTLTAPTQGALIRVNQITATFSSPDPNWHAFECKLSGPTPRDWSRCASGAAFAGLADGEHTLEVRAMKGPRNVDASPATASFVVDTTAPSVSLNAVPAAVVNSSEAAFTFQSEPGARFVCKLDSGPEQACDGGSATFTALPDGPHVFSVVAIDEAGNRGTAATAIWTSDTTGPRTTVLNPPSGRTNDVSAPLEFVAADGVSFTCELDGDRTPCASPHRLPNLDDGAHTFSVWATDAAGNAGAPATTRFTLDTTGPVVELMKTPPERLRTRHATIRFQAKGEPGARFECRRSDKGRWQRCHSPVKLRKLPWGPLHFEVRGVDDLGNRTAVPAQVNSYIAPRLLPGDSPQLSWKFQDGRAVIQRLAVYAEKGAKILVRCLKCGRSMSVKARGTLTRVRFNKGGLLELPPGAHLRIQTTDPEAVGRYWDYIWKPSKSNPEKSRLKRSPIGCLLPPRARQGNCPG